MFSTAVWVGHPESRDPTGFGGPTAGPIWQSFMSAAQGGNCPDFPVPSDTPTLHALHSSNTRSASEVPSTPVAPGAQPNTGSGDQGSKQGDQQGQGTPQTTSPVAPPSSPSPPPAVGGGLTPGGGVATP
jgi:membrane peptidoglycan carboxypeptidase